MRIIVRYCNREIAVVDIATHPDIRPAIIEDAIKAGKHILSQKPFVLDLDEGERLVALADKAGVRLAVNQNGRWAPHFAYIREAIQKGLIGEVMSARLSVHWNHDAAAGTVFDEIPHLLLYDFAIHLFDIIRIFMGDKQPRQVCASIARAPEQRSKPPLLGQSMIDYDGGQASLAFDGFAKCQTLGSRLCSGDKGKHCQHGTESVEKKVTLYTAKGYGSPKLRGTWFTEGFHGTMAELLRAIEEKREPYNSGRDNLESLALCFAAVASAENGGGPRFPASTAHAALILFFAHDVLEHARYVVPRGVEYLLDIVEDDVDAAPLPGHREDDAERQDLPQPGLEEIGEPDVPRLLRKA